MNTSERLASAMLPARARGGCRLLLKTDGSLVHATTFPTHEDEMNDSFRREPGNCSKLPHFPDLAGFGTSPGGRTRGGHRGGGVRGGEDDGGHASGPGARVDLPGWG